VVVDSKRWPQVNYAIDTVIGLISLSLLMAAIVYPIYVVLGVIERRQRRNKRVRTIPPKCGFRGDANGPVTIRRGYGT
jgi:hypothetical protein